MNTSVFVHFLQIYEFTKNGAIYLPEVELKNDIAKIVTSLNNLDPLRLLPDIR